MGQGYWTPFVPWTLSLSTLMEGEDLDLIMYSDVRQHQVDARGWCSTVIVSVQMSYIDAALQTPQLPVLGWTFTIKSLELLHQALPLCVPSVYLTRLHGLFHPYSHTG